MLYKFESATAKENFAKQISKAKPLVRLPARLGVFVLRFSGPSALRIPILKVVARSALALVSMHNAVKTGPFRETSQDARCTFEAGERIDLLIAGSGPGGAITARHAKDRSLKILVVELGTVTDKSVPQHGPEQMFRSFANGGQDVILSWPMVPFAEGSAWGGGSQINSGLYHSLPESVLQNWSRATGISVERLCSAGEKTHSAMKVQTQEKPSLGIYSRSPLKAMGVALGWQGGLIPRWRNYSRDGYEHFGMEETYLSSLAESEKLTGHKVLKVSLRGHEVITEVAGGDCRHEIVSARVCLAAGTIGTPEILIRSKLAKVKEFKIAFHAMHREVGVFSQEVNDLHDIDPHQYWNSDGSIKIGAAVGTPELIAATLASKGIEYAGSLGNLGCYYASVPSSGRGGLVKIFGRISPYFLQDQSMRQATATASQILRGAIEKVGGKPLGSGEVSLSTVHIFGSLPLGASTVIGDDGDVRGTQGMVFVRDASLLPSHPLVNPQGPMMQLIEAMNQ